MAKGCSVVNKEDGRNTFSVYCQKFRQRFFLYKSEYCEICLTPTMKKTSSRSTWRVKKGEKRKKFDVTYFVCSGCGHMSEVWSPAD